MSGYQDRLQGKVRLFRIRRIRALTLGALASVTAFVLFASLLGSGASLKPLYLPLGTILQVGLIMGLLALIAAMYFRNLEIKNAQGDSQRFLMAKYSMNRAKWAAGLAIGLAIILLLPGASAAGAGLFTEPPRTFAIPSSTMGYLNFTSPDAFGVSYVREIAVIVSRGDLRISVLKDEQIVNSSLLTTSARWTLPISPSDASGLANWSVRMYNPAGGTASASLSLYKSVTSSLFAVIPFLLILFGAANVGWWIGLRPIRDRTRSASVYGGGVSTKVEQDERFYIEYATQPAPSASLAEPPPPPPPPPPSAPPPPIPAVREPVEKRRPAPPRPVAARVDTAETFTQKAQVLLDVGQAEAALVAFEEALRLDPSYLPAVRGKAACLLRMDRKMEALAVTNRILATDQGDEQALRTSAKLLADATRWREALETADELLRRRPNDAPMLELKGDALVALGQRAEALAAYEAAHALDPANGNVRQKIEEVRVDVPGLLSRALIASASGNYAAALNLFDEILEVEPSNVNALIGKAVAYRRRGKPQEALNCLDLVLGIQPGNIAALLNRGHILEEQGDLDAALETFDRLVALSPGDEEAWTAQGNVLMKMGRDDDALRAYAEALKLSPGDEDIQARIKELEEARSIQSDVLHDLYKVKGIGPAKAKALIEAGYKTAEDFAKATVDDLMAVKGVTRKIAQDLVKHFKGSLVEAH